MIELYPDIKLLHVAAVVASGSLLFLRGTAVLAGQQWAMRPRLRYLSYAIDTLLLAAALMLLAILPPAVYQNGWLMIQGWLS